MGLHGIGNGFESQLNDFLNILPLVLASEQFVRQLRLVRIFLGAEVASDGSELNAASCGELLAAIYEISEIGLSSILKVRGRSVVHVAQLMLNDSNLSIVLLDGTLVLKRAPDFSLALDVAVAGVVEHPIGAARDSFVLRRVWRADSMRRTRRHHVAVATQFIIVHVLSRTLLDEAFVRHSRVVHQNALELPT